MSFKTTRRKQSALKQKTLYSAFTETKATQTMKTNQKTKQKQQIPTFSNPFQVESLHKLLKYNSWLVYDFIQRAEQCVILVAQLNGSRDGHKANTKRENVQNSEHCNSQHCRAFKCSVDCFHTLDYACHLQLINEHSVKS